MGDEPKSQDTYTILFKIGDATPASSNPFGMESIEPLTFTGDPDPITKNLPGYDGFSPKNKNEIIVRVPYEESSAIEKETLQENADALVHDHKEQFIKTYNEVHEIIKTYKGAKNLPKIASQYTKTVEDMTKEESDEFKGMGEELREFQSILGKVSGEEDNKAKQAEIFKKEDNINVSESITKKKMSTQP